MVQPKPSDNQLAIILLISSDPRSKASIIPSVFIMVKTLLLK